MRKVISSPFTFFLKFLLPAGWLAIGLSGLFVRLVQRQFDGSLLFICLWLGVSLLVFWRGMFPLKKVALGDDSLHVSNFLREIEIPFSEVQGVKAIGFGWFHWPMPSIIVSLKVSSEFGERIKFMPGLYFKDVVAELNMAVERSLSLTGGRA
jgi:hypothetical protein